MWKKHKLVLLTNNDKTSPIGKYQDTKNFVYNSSSDIPRGIPQHLYLLSDEKIQNDDKLAYDKLENKIADYRNENASLISIIGRKYSKDYLVPIIASTDPSLNLPTFSESFIKKYCKLNGIEEVMVECYSGVVKQYLPKYEPSYIEIL